MAEEEKPESPEDFERLLTQVSKKLEKALAGNKKLSPFDFEEAVKRAMEQCAKGTKFENKIKRTKQRDFPDIVVGDHFGVEVKLTLGDDFTSPGNSIFESSRDASAKELYVLIGKLGGSNPQVKWGKYGKSIYDIVVTHSPRYRIKLDDKTSLFDGMDMDYDEFSELTNEQKMERVRRLYEGRGEKARNLWWLDLQPRDVKYCLWGELSKESKEKLRAQLLFLFPSLLGKSNNKNLPPYLYLLSRGVIIRNFRDIFTAGGRFHLGGKSYPKIIKVVLDHKDLIKKAAKEFSVPVINESWRTCKEWKQLPNGASTKKKLEEWKRLIRSEYEGDFPENFFEE